MKYEEGLVSVIIPTYNRAELLLKSVRSCLAQNYEKVEVLIIDDGSEDDTKEKLSSLIGKKNGEKTVHYFYQENQGACAARNYGMSLAKGEFIQFLDSDDTLNENKFAVQVKAIKNENTPVAICDFCYIDENEKIKKVVVNDGDIFKYIGNFRSVSIFTPLIHANSLLSNLHWNNKITRHQDMDFLFKYFLTIRNWSYTPGVYCCYNTYEDCGRISDSYNKTIFPGLELYKSMKTFYCDNKFLLDRKKKKILLEYRKVLLRKLLKSYFSFAKKIATSFFS